MKLFVDNTGRFGYIANSIAYYKEMGISLAIEPVRLTNSNIWFWLLYTSSEKLVADIQKFHPSGIRLREHSSDFYDFKVLEIKPYAMPKIIQFMVEHYGLELGGEE